jgi:hypothetical protein
VAGPGTIVRLTFAGLVDGTSFLRCRRGLLRDGNNNPVPFNCADATLTYLCPVPQTPTGWGMLKNRYR